MMSPTWALTVPDAMIAEITASATVSKAFRATLLSLRIRTSRGIAPPTVRPTYPPIVGNTPVLRGKITGLR